MDFVRTRGEREIHACSREFLTDANGKVAPLFK